MRLTFSKLVYGGIIALVGGASANASPTFMPTCFDSEAKAVAHQKKFEYVEKDFSTQQEQEKRVTDLLNLGDVKLSEIEAILGASEVHKNSLTNRDAHKWNIYYHGSPSAGQVHFSASQGYCVETRYPGVGIVTFTWTSEGYDTPYGRLSRFEFYM